MDQEDVQLELDRISRSIPDDLMDNLIVEREKAPAIKETIEKALEDPDFPDEKKPRYRSLLESGRLDGTIEVQDEDVVEKIDEYLEEEIQKSIDAGRLPDRDSDEFKELANPLTNDEQEGTSTSTEA